MIGVNFKRGEGKGREEKGRAEREEKTQHNNMA
jgi:hypothetical protein